jgi:Kef-type K+ transport system membrane component KefB
MRRFVILLLLLGLMQLLEPLGSAGYGSQVLLTFGFLILAAYTVGEIATGMRVPKIVGYLVAGMIFGPSALGVVGAEVVTRLGPVSELAIALIAFLAGAELKWSEVREHGTALLRIMSAELLISFLVLATVMYLASGLVPFLATATRPQVIACSLLFASIAIVHSPAVTMALLTETGARGPVARTTLGVVLLADVVVVLLFSAMLAVARALEPGAGGGGSLGMVTWEILGALLVGAILGTAVAAYLRFVGEELFLFALLVTFLGSEIARLAHVETLLMLLTAGFAAENLSRDGRGDALRHAMERSAAPVFVVFFALAGAKIDVRMVVSLIALVVPLALARGGAIWLGTRVGSRWAGIGEERQYVWMGLISQAGVAIGLATVVAEAYPGFGPDLRTLMLALIAINETLGPILFRRALVRSGEVAVQPSTGELAPAPGAH